MGKVKYLTSSEHNTRTDHPEIKIITVFIHLQGALGYKMHPKLETNKQNENFTYCKYPVIRRTWNYGKFR